MRVIVVGSGLSGLVMGHCLLRAGIDDFVILERRLDAVETTGAGIALWAQTFRIFDQLDILDDVTKITVPMKRWVHMNPQGHVDSDGHTFEMVTERHGYPLMVFLRSELMELLYSKLPGNKSRVIPDKKVAGIEQDDNGVTVTCVDGSTFQGDVLLGCDGVHSAVRRLVFQGDTGKKSKSPFTAEYQCIFGHGPRLPDLPPCDMAEVHDKGIDIVILSTLDRSFWFLVNAKAKGAPISQKYSAEEVEALADKYADHPASWGGKVTFGDLWRTKASASMYDLHEGVAKKWYDGRVAIIGDAAHMMTPSLGLGGNNAIESVASVVNQLHKLLKEKSNPTTAEIEKAFALFQNERRGRAVQSSTLTGIYCRWACWRTWFHWFMQAKILPFLGDGFVLKYVLSPWIRDGVKLDFAEEKHLPPGTVPWKYR